MGNEPAVFLRIILLFVIAAQQLHANLTNPTHTLNSLEQEPAGAAGGSVAAVHKIPSTTPTDVLHDDNHFYTTDQGSSVTHTTSDLEGQNVHHKMVEAVDSQTPPITAQNLDAESDMIDSSPYPFMDVYVRPENGKLPANQQKTVSTTKEPPRLAAESDMPQSSSTPAVGVYEGPENGKLPANLQNTINIVEHRVPCLGINKRLHGKSKEQG
ncbi:uncharacterized protein LOC144762757 [Lissotriton helveticus]